MPSAAQRHGESGSSFGRAAGLMAGGSLLSQAVIAGATWWLARRISADALGTYAFLQVTATTIGGVAAFGPGIGLARTAALGATGAIGRALGSATLAAAALCGVSAAAEFGAGPWLGATWPQGVVTTLLALVAAVQGTVLQGLLGAESYARVSAARVVGGGVTAAGLLVAAWLRAPLLALAVWGLGAAVSTATAASALGRGPSTGAPASADGWSMRWAFLAAMLAAPILWAAQGIVALADRREMAALAVLAPLSAAILLVPSQASQAMIAPMARGEWPRLWRSGAWLALGAGVAPALALAATATWWAPWLLPGQPALAQVAVPLAIGIAVQAAMAPFVRFLEARAPTAWTAVLNAGWALMLLTGTWRTPTAVGYARSMALAFTLHGVALLVACRVVATPGARHAS